ncbi:MAG: hypothetical protein KC729_13740, partial [Candidatus Eisenbacteria bacterium]|nr:hypothetical protein [Candidatus Eisenbacteria bacterium]
MHRSWRLFFFSAAALCTVSATTVMAQHTFQDNIIYECFSNANPATSGGGLFSARELVDALCNDEPAVSANELLVNPYAPATPFVTNNTGWAPKETSIAVGSRGCGIAAAAQLIARQDQDPTCECTPRDCPNFIVPVCYRGAVPPASFLLPGQPQWYEGWINTTYGSSDVPALPVKLIGPGNASDGDANPWVWEPGFTYVLRGRCSVPAGQTLTILPGVLVRAGSNAPPDYLVCEPGGKMNAQGTAQA